MPWLAIGRAVRGRGMRGATKRLSNTRNTHQPNTCFGQALVSLTLCYLLCSSTQHPGAGGTHLAALNTPQEEGPGLTYGSQAYVGRSPCIK